eukprot:8602127-Karenia_brevis.AAC.1
MHDKLRQCANTQIEYVLGKACLGFSRVTHLLRTNGMTYAEEHGRLRDFDAVQRSTLERLAPGITDAGFAQSELCVSAGGLGWRSASTVALPAALAGRIMARPKVEEMAVAMERAGLMDIGSFMQHFDGVTAQAIQRYADQLDREEKDQVVPLVQAAAEQAKTQWMCIRAGVADKPALSDPAQGVRWSDPESQVENEDVSGPPARSTSIVDGALRQEPDDEGVMSGTGRLTVVKLQRALLLLGDNTRLRSLLQDRADACDHEGLRRLTELRHPDTCHAWLWQICPEDGTILRDQDFSTAMRHR